MRVAKTCGWLLFTILLIAVAGFVFIRLSPDYDIYIVRSQSMEPTINMGDLAIVTHRFGEIKPGMIVTYEYSGGGVVTHGNGDKLVTHRVVSVDKGQLITKGDAVDDPDPLPVALASVRGTFLFRLSYAGYLANFVSSRVGWFSLIVFPALVLVAFLIKDIFKEAKRLRGGDV